RARLAACPASPRPNRQPPRRRAGRRTRAQPVRRSRRPGARRSSSQDALRLELVELLVVEADDLREHIAVVLAEQRRRAPVLLLGRRELDRRALELGPTDDRVVELEEDVTRRHLGI